MPARNRNTKFDPRSLYYRLSGEFSLAAAFLLLFAGSLAAALAGAAYAYVDFFLPPYLRFLPTLALGIGLGLLLGSAFRRLKIRHTPVTGLIAIVLATITVGSAWIVWVDAYLGWIDSRAAANAARHDASIASLLAHPGETFTTVFDVALNGHFKIGPHAPAGIELLALWMLEALILYTFIIWLPLRKIRSSTFCERCQRWGVTKNLCQTSPTNPAALREAVEFRKLAAVTASGPPANPHNYFQISIEGCPTCNATQTLTITHITLSAGKPKRAPIFRRFVLSPEEYITLTKAAQALTAPAAPQPAATQATA